MNYVCWRYFVSFDRDRLFCVPSRLPTPRARLNVINCAGQISWSLFSPRVQSINYDLMAIRSLNWLFHSPPHWLYFCNNARSEWWSVFNLSLALERWIALNKCWPWNGEQVNRDVSLILTGEGLAQGQGWIARKNLIDLTSQKHIESQSKWCQASHCKALSSN